MTQPRGGQQANQAPALPWAGWPDVIGCNFALGHITRNLGAALMVDGRLHAESYVSAAGAAAGLAAHISLMSDDEARNRAIQAGEISIVTTNDGRELLYGDAINNMLMAANAARAPLCAWNNMAGAAISNGLAQSDLPDINAMFAHVTKSIGTPREGLPSIEGHDPMLAVVLMLKRVWPLVHDCLTGEIDPVTKRNAVAANKPSWAPVTAVAAGRIVAECCSIMPPKIALTIAMESAIYASKLMAR